MWLVRVIAGVFTCPAWLPHLQFSHARWSLAQPASSRHNYRLLIRPYVPFLNNVLTLDYLPRKERGTDDMVKQEQTRLIFSKNSSPNQLVHRSQFPSCTVDSGFQLTLITSEQNVAIQENQSTSIRRSQSWMMSLMMRVCVCVPTYIHNPPRKLLLAVNSSSKNCCLYWSCLGWNTFSGACAELLIELLRGETLLPGLANAEHEESKSQFKDWLCLKMNKLPWPGSSVD